MRPLFWRGMVVGTECKKWIGSNQLSESKINEINSEYMGSSILFNLNRSGAGLETFLWSAWICMFEFLFCFSSGSVLFWILKRDILLVWLFALLHVFWKTKKKNVCLFCLELLNTLCFTIIRLEVTLLLACIKKLNPRPPTSSLFVKTFKAEFSFDEHCLWLDFRANPRRLYQVMKTMSLVLKLPTRCYRHVLTRKLTYIKQMKLRSCLKVVVVLFFS